MDLQEVEARISDLEFAIEQAAIFMEGHSCSGEERASVEELMVLAKSMCKELSDIAKELRGTP